MKTVKERKAFGDRELQGTPCWDINHNVCQTSSSHSYLKTSSKAEVVFSGYVSSQRLPVESQEKLPDSSGEVSLEGVCILYSLLLSFLSFLVH